MTQITIVYKDVDKSIKVIMEQHYDIACKIANDNWSADVDKIFVKEIK